MKVFKIYLRNRITELDVAIRELARYIETAVQHHIQLLAGDTLMTATKYVSGMENNTMLLKEQDLTSVRSVYERSENAMRLLTEEAEAASTKFASCTNGLLELTNSNINAILVRYRLLSEADGSVESVEFTLGDFDELEMDKVDFITID